MKITEKVQFEGFKSDSYILADEIKEILSRADLKEVCYIFGVIKDEAYEILKENMHIASDRGVNFKFTVGIDRRNISKDVLKDILSISDDVYVYNNNAQDDFNAKLYIFKFEDCAEVIIPSSNFTMRGITIAYSNITKINFDLKNDIEQYNEFMFGIKEYIYPDVKIFKKLDEKLIDELELKRDLLITKKNDDTLPSIEDYLKKTALIKRQITDEEIEEKINSKLDNIIKEFDIKIDDDGY